MQKREAEAKSPRRERIYVPFSWEEKPGVPKEDPSNMSLHADSYQLIPLQPPNQYTYSPLHKPPCLQPFPAPCTAQLHHSSSPKFLVRKQSFNNIITSTTSIKPLSRKYSHGNLQLHTRPRSGHHAAASKMEDDPFFMAIQACRKGTYTFQEKPIRLYHHEINVRCREDVSVRQRQNGSDHVEDFKHHTIRQLFTQQLQEEEEQLKRGQKEPLINVSTSQKKHNKGPFSIFARCFGFY